MTRTAIPDLYVANDFGRNALFQNNSDGTLADVSKQAGAPRPRLWHERRFR